VRVTTALVATLGTVAVLTLALVGCRAPDVRTPTAAVTEGGDQASGREAIVVHGCGACHRIPGIPNADALVGPPLDSWSRRSFIAGTLPNTAENLAVWLEDPQEIRPGSAMPTLEMSETEIADIVAYLFSLR
jgi:cytochrome c